jgi:hypothetical protein
VARVLEQHHAARRERAGDERRSPGDCEHARVVRPRAQRRRRDPFNAGQVEVGGELVREPLQPLEVARDGRQHLRAEPLRVLERVEALQQHEPGIVACRGEQPGGFGHRCSVRCAR